MIVHHAQIQKGGRGSGPPRESHKAIGFLSNTSPDPIENHKVTKPAFNVWPPSVRQGNTDDGPLLVVFGSSLSSPTKKQVVKFDPL